MSVETATEIHARGEGMERVEVDWGDGARSVEPARDGDSSAIHRFRHPGAVAVVVVPVCAGETRGTPVRLNLDVLPPCARRRDTRVHEVDCDEARASLTVSDVGNQAPADWIDAPCRDAERIESVRPPGDPPARAADCLEYVGNPLVGPLYVYRGASLRLTFGAPVQRAIVRAGTRRVALRLVGDARRVNRTFRAWRLRLPRWVDPRRTRLHITAFRPGQADRYVIDLRPESG